MISRLRRHPAFARLALHAERAVSAISAFWASRNTRERTMVVAIAFAALAFRITALLDGLHDTRENLANLDAAREARETLLGAAPVVSNALNRRAGELEVARKLDAETVMARLEKLLAGSKLKAESGRPSTREAGAARTHSITLRAEAATLEQIVAFRRALDAAGLPLAMTGLELDANTADPAKLRARIELTAVQPK